MPDLPPLVPRKRHRKPDTRPTACKRGYDRRHRDRRAVMIARYPLCQSCHEAFSIDMDHIDGNAFNNDPRNLQMLCRSCHAKKTRRQQLGLL